MAELYTPFMEQVGATLGRGMMQRDQNKLAQSAYMGDQDALGQLMGVNPELANKIQSGKATQQQNKLMAAQKSEDRTRKISGENQAILKDIFTNAVKFDTFEEAAAYADGETAKQRDILGDMPPFTQEAYEQGKQIEGEGQPFGGTGMEAQVGNMLTRGVEDPEYRNTPEYARAYQLATEPKIVRTPTGDMLQQPNLPDMFKPPGAEANPNPLTADEVTTLENTPPPGKPKSAVIIPGTEKISVDQKAYNKDYVLLKKSYDSMQNYIDVLDDLGPEMSFGPINTKNAQRLESSYRRAMLDAKETNGLGVLNGPDMGIMRQFMGDPTGLMGQIKGRSSLLEGANQAMKQITDNFGTLNTMMEDTPVKIRGLKSKEQKKAPKINESNLTVTIEGKIHTFPSIEKLNAYKEAAGY